MIVYDSWQKQLKTGLRHSTENTVHICEDLLCRYVTTRRRIAEIWEKKNIILSNIHLLCPKETG